MYEEEFIVFTSLTVFQKQKPFIISYLKYTTFCVVILVETADQIQSTYIDKH